MRRILVSLVLILPVCMVLAESRGIAPEYNFSFSIPSKTKYAISGELSLYGKLTAKTISKEMLPIDALRLVRSTNLDLSPSIDYILDSDLSAIMLKSATGSVENLDEIYLLSLSDNSISRFEDSLLFLNDLSLFVTGVDVYATIGDTLSFGIVSLGEMDVSSERYMAMFVVSDDDLTLNIKNSPVYVMMPIVGDTPTGKAYIVDRNGKEVWENSKGDWLILIRNDMPRIRIPSSLKLILFDDLESFHLEVSRSKSAPSKTLLSNLSSYASLMEESSMEIPDILEKYISIIMDVLNGAYLSVGSNGTIVIDLKEYEFSRFCLLRFSRATFDFKGDKGECMIEGRGRSTLILLGDRIYQDVSTTNIGGIPIPTQSLALWLLAIAIFIIFSLVLKEGEKGKVFGKLPLDIDDRTRRIVGRVFLATHLIFAILTILLFDNAFDEIFGLSFINYLGTNPFISLVIICSELVFISICFLMFGLPTRILVNSIVSFVGFGKEGRNVGKSLSLVAVWLLSFPYITFLSNAFLGLAKDIIMGMLP